MLTLDSIRNALGQTPPTRLPDPPHVRDHAAVALVFAGDPQALELCFIRRVARDGDPWSGQMAFPGGRASAEDPDIRAVAKRETFEEVGLLLNGAELLGRLSDQPIHRSIAGRQGVLSPFAFYVGASLPSLHPQDEEVDAAFWIAVAHLWDAQHRDTVVYERKGSRYRFPGIRHGEDIIWGLTRRVLTSLGELVGVGLP